jgi:hypothetical protein
VQRTDDFAAQEIKMIDLLKIVLHGGWAVNREIMS